MNQPSHTKANNKKKRDTSKFPSTLKLLVVMFSIVLAIVVIYWLFYPKPYRIPCNAYYEQTAKILQESVDSYVQDPAFAIRNFYFFKKDEIPPIEEFLENVFVHELQRRTVRKLTNGITANDLKYKLMLTDYFATNNRSSIDVIIYSPNAKCGSRGIAFVHYGTGKREWLDEYGDVHEND